MNSSSKWIIAILVAGLMAVGVTISCFLIYVVAERMASLDRTISLPPGLSAQRNEKQIVGRKLTARIYFQLIRAFACASGGRSDTDNSPSDRPNELAKAEQQLLLYGSSRVINFYSKLQLAASTQIRLDASPLDLQLRQMRTEIGQTNAELNSIVLVQLFQNTTPERQQPAPLR